MRTGLFIASFLLLPLVAFGNGEKCELAERFEKGETCSVAVKREMAIDIEVAFKGGERKVPMHIKTALEYCDRVVEVSESGLPSKLERRYDKAVITTEEAAGSVTRSLPFEGKIYVIEKDGKGAKVSSEGNDKIAEEEKKELATAVAGKFQKLLPGREVGKGEKWDVPLDTIREIFSISRKITGKAKASLTEIEEKEDGKTALVTLEVDVKTDEGAMTMSYRAGGRIRFDLESRKIKNLDSVALVEVEGSQESRGIKLKYSGGGSVKITYNSSPAKEGEALEKREKKETKEGE